MSISSKKLSISLSSSDTLSFKEEQEHAANHRIINDEDSSPVRNELRKIFAKPMAHWIQGYLDFALSILQL